MPYDFRLTRQVEFSDTDLAGMMHFSNFFRFMEAAEHAFFRNLGFSIARAGNRQPVGWPRVHAECDYKHPLHFEDRVEIRLLVREKRPRSIVYDFRFRKLNGHPGTEVARGTLTVACVKRDKSSGKMRGVPIPRAIADKIEVAPAGLLD